MYFDPFKYPKENIEGLTDSLAGKVSKSGDIMTGELFCASAYIGTASSKSTNKIEASLDGSEITCTLYRSPLPSTQEITDMPSGYTACRINLFESDGTTLIADKVLFDGDEWTYDLGSVTSIKLRKDFLAISTFGEEIIDGNGNQLSLKADTATVEAELAEKVDYADISSEKTVTGNPITIPDALPVPVKSLVANVEPIQDLHGYEYPWVGGADKNKYKATSGSQSANGVTLTHMGSGIYKCTGKATALTQFSLGNFTCPSGSYILNGCPEGGAQETFDLRWTNNYVERGSGVTITSDGTTTAGVVITIRNGYDCGTDGIIFKPMVRLSTITDATFAPYSNICPISGWTESKVTVEGKNTLDESTKVQNRYINDSGSVQNANGSAYFSQYIKVKDGAQYTISLDKTGSGSSYSYYFRVHGYNANKECVEMIYKSPTTITTAGKYTFTVNIPNGISYIRISFGNDIENTMVEIGSSATAYVPYVTPNIATIDLDGTRYGGYTTVDENGVTKFVGTYSLNEYDGSEDEIWYPNGSSNNFYMIGLSDALYASGVKTCFSNEFETLADTSQWATISASDNKCLITKDGSLIRLAISYKKVSNVTEFKTFLSNSPLQIRYKLATPIEVTLSNTNIPLLDGYNNVWCDSGDVTLTYLANRCYESETKLEQSEVATVESGNTASRAYAVNEFMMWKGGLYKVTQAIASGATITSGTNVTKTTIGAVLTALLNG